MSEVDEFGYVTATKPILVEPSSLELYGSNAKLHTAEQVSAIAKSIREFGWGANPIEITKDHLVVNGHGRLLAAHELGMKKVPCVILENLSDDQIRAYRLAHNKVAEGKYDTQKMADEIAYLVNESELDSNLLSQLQFNERDLEVALDDLGEMNVDVLADNIGEQLEKHASDTNQFVDEEEKVANVPLREVFGFSFVNLKQQRMIKRLLVYAENETGEEGAEALSEWAQTLMTEKA